MSQNLVTLNLTDAQINAVEAALTELETQLAGLIALLPQQKRKIQKMGRKSEAFCRQTLRVLEQNPQIVPPNMSVPDALGDLTQLGEGGGVEWQIRHSLGRVAQLVRAPASHAGGHRFESCRAHHSDKLAPWRRRCGYQSAS